MKLILILAISFNIALSARLDNLYLPPATRTAGSVANLVPPFGNAGSFAKTGISSSANSQIPILKFAADNDGEGSYRYSYESANSINAEEQGDARGDGTKAHGSYSYTAPDGQLISVTYTADENGFVAQGAHLPTPPPVPEAILKSLAENAAAEAQGVYDDGQYRGEGLNEGQYRSGAGNAGQSAIGGYANNGGYRY